jgi:hypothetical protein
VDGDATCTISGKEIVTVDGSKVYYMDLASLELVISTDKEVTMDNPVITYVV